MTSTSIRGSLSIRTHQKIALLLLAGLLFLRIPLLGGVGYFVQTPPDWLDSLFQIGTYLLMAILIWWEKDRLADFHIDGLAIAIIILFKPIQTIILDFWGFRQLFLAFPNPGSLILWAIALGLALALLVSHSTIPKPQVISLGWFGIGTLAGIVIAIALGFPMSFQIPPSQINVAIGYKTQLLQALTPVFPSFPYQLGYAAVSEEPLFRGFLWGYLRKAGWRDVWIFLFQAGLFWLSHIYYLNRAPISFWIIVPVGAVVFGLMAWRSHSICTSMAAHASVNALGYSIGYLIAVYRFS